MTIRQYIEHFASAELSLIIRETQGHLNLDKEVNNLKQAFDYIDLTALTSDEVAIYDNEYRVKTLFRINLN
jgi:hypothetical protein